LKGEAPAIGLLIVKSKQINVLVLTDILPLGKGLIEDVQFREVLSDDSEDC
jgi:hypothetical protein